MRGDDASLTPHLPSSTVANMFLIPMGIALGAEVSAFSFVVRNLVPVTVSY